MLPLNQAEIGPDPSPLHQRDKAQPTLARQQIELRWNVVAPDHVEDRINPAAAGELLANLHKILGAVIDRNICAVIEARPACLGGAGGGRYLCAERLAELDRGIAEVARAGLCRKTFLPRPTTSLAGRTPG